MLFKEFGNKTAPAFIALHGGGLSWWSLQKVIDLLKTDYYVVVPVIDGHGDDSATTFVSIQDSAQKLIEYIDQKFNGKIFAISGLSIGAQIVAEVLSKRPDISEYAVIESALVYPIKGIAAMAAPTYTLLYGLIQTKWFAKIQSKALYIPDEMFELYYRDSIKMSKQSLINIALSNGRYSLDINIAGTAAKTLILVGSKEQKIMIKSARELHEAIGKSRLQIMDNMSHGEISMRHHDKYVDIIRQFIANDSQPRVMPSEEGRPGR